jgi:hypothetical protein
LKSFSYPPNFIIFRLRLGGEKTRKENNTLIWTKVKNITFAAHFIPK